MSDFPVGVAALRRALASGAVSSVEATRHYLRRIERTNPSIGACITVMAERAMEAAEASDRRRLVGMPIGPLDGVPVAAKDNIDVAGVPTTGGIGHYRGAMATADAFVVETLRDAGAVLLAKLNMHEGALGATNDNPFYGRCRNPLRDECSPGGSSGGSGAAVAAGFCAAALGTDTLGSVRIPAAYCGTASIKPTYGLVSTRGVMALSWTLDHVGWLAPRVADLRPLLATTARFDASWAFAREGGVVPSANRTASADVLRGLRVGVFREFPGTEVESEILAAYADAQRALASAGATLVDITLPGYDFTRVRREVLVLIEIEGGVVHGEAIARDPEGFSAEFRSMIAFGAKQPAARAAIGYRRLAELRTLLREAVKGADVLMLPTSAQVAFRFDGPVPVNQADLCGIANLLEAPAGCVPWGTGRDGLPASMQVVGKPFEDERVLDVLEAMERIKG